MLQFHAKWDHFMMSINFIYKANKNVNFELAVNNRVAIYTVIIILISLKTSA